jgi:type II secretory pathway pseudopilin PulG
LEVIIVIVVVAIAMASLASLASGSSLALVGEDMTDFFVDAGSIIVG